MLPVGASYAKTLNHFRNSNFSNWVTLSLHKKLGLGQLPGDLMFKSGNSTFFFPIVTCIIISVVLTIIFNLFK